MSDGSGGKAPGIEIMFGIEAMPAGIRKLFLS
jgi:hypothetical protein